MTELLEAIAAAITTVERALTIAVNNNASAELRRRLLELGVELLTAKRKLMAEMDRGRHAAS